MKSNLLAVVLTLFVTSPALAQHHHHHHQTGGSGGGYPSHYNQNYPYQHARVVQPVIAYPVYYPPYRTAYPGVGYGCFANRSTYYRPTYVQNNYPIMQLPQPQSDFVSRPQVVARRPSTPSSPATPEQLAAISRAIAPKQLTSEQYDRETGKLTWPVALLSEDFASDRATLEQIFADRASLSDEEWKIKTSDLRRLTASLREQLSAQVKELRPTEFLAAKKFLDGLSREIPVS